MIHLFSGNNYQQIYDKVLSFIQQYNTEPLFLRVDRNIQKIEEIDTIIYYFLLPPQKNFSILIIEHPENIKEQTVLRIISRCNDLSEKHLLIFITDKINQVSKNILSHATIFNNQEEIINTKYKEFLKDIKSELLTRYSIEELLEKHKIIEEDTILITNLLIQSYPEKNKQLQEIKKNIFHILEILIYFTGK